MHCFQFFEVRSHNQYVRIEPAVAATLVQLRMVDALVEAFRVIAEVSISGYQFAHFGRSDTLILLPVFVNRHHDGREVLLIGHKTVNHCLGRVKRVGEDALGHFALTCVVLAGECDSIGDAVAVS